MRDRKYTPGGSDHDDTGSYEDDHSIASRAGRLFMMERGNWIGGRGRQIGSRLHTLKKIDEQSPAEVQRMVAEAFEPLTSTGEMGALEVSSELIPGSDNALGDSVTWTDHTQADSVSHERSSGRQG